MFKFSLNLNEFNCYLNKYLKSPKIKMWSTVETVCYWSPAPIQRSKFTEVEIHWWRQFQWNDLILLQDYTILKRWCEQVFIKTTDQIPQTAVWKRKKKKKSIVCCSSSENSQRNVIVSAPQMGEFTTFLGLTLNKT